MTTLILNKNTLQAIISIYEELESMFGIDEDGKIIYDHTINDMLKEYVESCPNEYVPYTDVFSFFELIDYMTKQDVVTKLNDLSSTTAKTASHEQLAIVGASGTNVNIAVDAVAGSGKTTTVMFIAQKNSDKKIMQITYNSELKLEVRQTMEQNEIDNVEIHSYHSMAVKFYDGTARTDDGIMKILATNKPCKRKAKIDILIIDESQDMTPNYYKLVKKFIRDNNLNCQLIILGDRDQGIYDFKNADTRFLTLADHIWNNTRPFVKLPLQTSFRVTQQIAWFVNNVMIGQQKIISTKQSKNKIYYYKQNKFRIHDTIYQQIRKGLRDGKKPEDIFILAGSLKSNEALKKLEHLLVAANIPTYYARNDEEGLSESKIKGKIVFTTFHQSKGRERDMVIIYGFEESYFDYNARTRVRQKCPPELYVAVTRAKDLLILVEHETDNPLPFLKMSHDEMIKCPYIEFIGIPKKSMPNKEVKPTRFHTTSVTEITKYLDETTLEKIIDMISSVCTQSVPPCDSTTVNLPTVMMSDKNLVEDVSDLIGLVIPAMWEHKKSGRSSLYKIVREKSNTVNDDSFLKNAFKKLKNEKLMTTVGDFLYLGNLYIAITENIHNKLAQIDKYDWLTKEMVDKCHTNLDNNVGKKMEYEKKVGNECFKCSTCYVHNTNEYGCVHIAGRLDAIDKGTVWEFKCVNDIQVEHLLQVILYAWLWNKSMMDSYGSRKFKLLNIRTGQIVTINAKSHLIDQIAEILLCNKYSPKMKDTDDEFVTKCNDVSIENNDSDNSNDYDSENEVKPTITVKKKKVGFGKMSRCDDY
jgi:hypothetical protein